MGLKHTTRHLVVFLCGIFIFASLCTPATASSYNPRYASIVIDANSGAVLSEKYPDKILHPASLTKMMTLYMTFDAIKQRRLSLNSRIYMSRHAANMIPSKIGLEPGESIQVKDAILALVTKSANDIAVALAEAIGGTESGFAQLMTRKAGELGMSRTVFRNASGLHHPKQVSTARDMARLARALMMDHPEFYAYFNVREFTYRGKSYHNHNRLLGRYQGMDGLKTGYVRTSGFNLAASAVRGNRRLIGIVFGGRSTHSRNRHMALLLDRGFAMSDIKVAQLAYEQRITPRARPVSGYQIAALDADQNPGRDELDDSFYSLEIGEGDIDPDRARQAINAPVVHKPVMNNRNWSIQVGAFMTHSDTGRALKMARQQLPHLLAAAKPQIIPMRSGNKLIYRARLTGMNKETATEACKLLNDCLRLAPGAR